MEAHREEEDPLEAGNMKYENLHVHTTTSDGQLSYQEMLDLSAQNDTGVVAFCDHDSLPSSKDLKILNKNRSHPTKWIIGIEISSGYPKEIGGPAALFHIIGLFVDPTNSALKKHCKKMSEGRQERVREMVSNLNKIGFKITVEDCLEESRGESLGRPHVVSAINKHKENEKVTKSILNKMEKRAQADKDIKHRYDKLMTDGPSQYPYVLYLTPDSFINDVFVPHPYYKNMNDSVSLIRKAGGVSILAHWHFSKHKVDLKMIDKLFEEERLDGAETVFGLGAIKNGPRDPVAISMEEMRLLTKKHGVLQSGGSDAHLRKDVIDFKENKWFAEKTIGLIEKLKKRVDLQFSSLEP